LNHPPLNPVVTPRAAASETAQQLAPTSSRLHRHLLASSEQRISDDMDGAVHVRDNLPADQIPTLAASIVVGDDVPVGRDRGGMQQQGRRSGNNPAWWIGIGNHSLGNGVSRAGFSSDHNPGREIPLQRHGVARRASYRFQQGFGRPYGHVGHRGLVRHKRRGQRSSNVHRACATRVLPLSLFVPLVDARCAGRPIAFARASTGAVAAVIRARCHRRPDHRLAVYVRAQRLSQPDYHDYSSPSHSQRDTAKKGPVGAVRALGARKPCDGHRELLWRGRCGRRLARSIPVAFGRPPVPFHTSNGATRVRGRGAWRGGSTRRGRRRWAWCV
jgi:hypothetical protein